MSGRRLSDPGIARALREYLPAAPHAGLHQRIRAEIEATPQSRSLFALRNLGHDAGVRRRRWLLAAAALMLLVLGAVGVGALLEERHRDPLPQLVLDPPADRQPSVGSGSTPAIRHPMAP